MGQKLWEIELYPGRPKEFQGANRPGGEATRGRIDQGAKRPGGESTRGRNAGGRNAGGRIDQGAKRRGAN